MTLLCIPSSLSPFPVTATLSGMSWWVNEWTQTASFQALSHQPSPSAHYKKQLPISHAECHISTHSLLYWQHRFQAPWPGPQVSPDIVPILAQLKLFSVSCALAIPLPSSSSSLTSSHPLLHLHPQIGLLMWESTSSTKLSIWWRQATGNPKDNT